MLKPAVVVPAIALLTVLLASCSGNVGRSNVEYGGEPSGLSYHQPDRANLARGPIRYWAPGEPAARRRVPGIDRDTSRTLTPFRLPPAPRPAARPLRRFAAMPRHMHPAPHVRHNEAACLNTNIVHRTRFVRPANPIRNGRCSVRQPFVMKAAAHGAISMNPPALLRCQMIPSVETWVSRIVRPAARHYLGQDVVEFKVAASYACRTRNSKRGARLSEHGTANALDISAFRLAGGSWITVKRGWRGSERERRFLRYIHRGACEHFSTVLGPNSDRYHHDHFHLDLARHGRHGTYRVCR